MLTPQYLSCSYSHRLVSLYKTEHYINIAENEESVCHSDHLIVV